MLLLFNVSTNAQYLNRTLIINSGENYYGTGISHNEQEARDLALKDLTSQIAITVRSSLVQKLKETLKNLEESVESVVETHSAATLRNVNTIKKMMDDGRIECFCYMKKSEVEKVWDDRRQLIANLVEEANKYTEEHNIAHAIKLYTFAALLTNSLPDENVVYQDVNYTIEIPKKVNSIILKTRFAFLGDTLLSDKEREITLAVLHDDKPTVLVDFMFWDGTNNINVQGRDGLGTFRLIDASIKFDELKLFIKTEYYESRKEYPIIETLWDLVNRPSYQSRKVIRLDKKQKLEDLVKIEKIEKPEKSEIKELTVAKYKYDFDIDYKDEVPVMEMIIQEANKFLEVIEEGKSDNAKIQFGDDPFLYEKVLNYMEHNHPKLLDQCIKGIVDKTRNGYELRRIRMLHDYPTIRKQSTEYLVLDFNNEGKLVDLNTSISNELYLRFVIQAEYGQDWGNRQEIIKFLEKYRTAYLTRDIKTVNLMFAEEAIIIVGRKLETKKLPEGMVKYQPFGRQPGYEYLRFTKQEYLKRQRQIFNSVEDIFLDFSTFNIVRKTKPSSIYGVEMRQTYLSTTYGDEGYLFLLIDFEPDTLSQDPLIYVRAWQPNAWSKEEMIRTGDFIVHK